MVFRIAVFVRLVYTLYVYRFTNLNSYVVAVPTQVAFARSYGVNFLAAGYNHPSIGSGGSGIYSADGDITYIAPVAHESTLVVSKVPKIKSRRNDRNINKAVHFKQLSRSNCTHEVKPQDILNSSYYFSETLFNFYTL